LAREDVSPPKRLVKQLTKRFRGNYAWPVRHILHHHRSRPAWGIETVGLPPPGHRARARCGRQSGSADPGMVIGMAAKKVTVTLDETQLDRIRALVAAGTAASVSGFVQHAVGVALDDVAGWGALLAEALRETGGALSDSERAWADEVLGIGSRSAA